MVTCEATYDTRFWADTLPYWSVSGNVLRTLGGVAIPPQPPERRAPPSPPGDDDDRPTPRGGMSRAPT